MGHQDRLQTERYMFEKMYTCKNAVIVRFERRAGLRYQLNACVVSVVRVVVESDGYYCTFYDFTDTEASTRRTHTHARLTHDGTQAGTQARRHVRRQARTHAGTQAGTHARTHMYTTPPSHTPLRMVLETTTGHKTYDFVANNFFAAAYTSLFHNFWPWIRAHRARIGVIQKTAESTLSAEGVPVKVLDRCIILRVAEATTAIGVRIVHLEAVFPHINVASIFIKSGTTAHLHL